MMGMTADFCGAQSYDWRQGANNWNQKLLLNRIDHYADVVVAMEYNKSYSELELWLKW